MKRSWLLLCVLAALALPIPASAQTAPERLILQPEAGTIFRVEGHYPQQKNVCPFKQRKPLLAKYRGQLELVRDDDGSIQLINSLSFSHYLRGLAEVPLSWPEAALRAQVIAARSYALATMRETAGKAKARGYDICATDQCQVYRGATIELGAYGERWVDAVESTKGTVLARDGKPVMAYYFSTSTGKTRKSFPSATSGPAYLDRVDGEDDDAPLARWTARIRLSDLDDILRARGSWPRSPVTRVTQDGSTIRIAGGGTTRTMTAGDFRIALNSEAPCRFPNRYPSKTGSQRGGPLPQTVPSSTFRLTQNDSTIVLRGRGWGHDVGMSQWGARSLAERGRDEAQILDHYYNASLQTIDEPDAIRVLAADEMIRIVIGIEGKATVRSGTGSTLAPGKTFEVRTGRDGLRVRRSSGPKLKSVLSLRAATDRIEQPPGGTAAIAFTTSRSARVTITIADGDGTVVHTTEETSYESGEHTVDVPLSDEQGTELPPGTYSATVEAYDGLDRIRSRPIAIVIAAPAAQPEAPASDRSDDGGSKALPILLAAIAVVGAGGLLVLRRKITRT